MVNEYVYINRIKNYICKYGTEKSEENFKKLKNVIKEKNILYVKKS